MGPVSWYGGGRRRSKAGSGSWLGFLLVLGLIALAIKYWYVTIPLAIVFALVIRGMRSRKRQQYQAWLAAPPPSLVVPGRFTQNWIASNVPHLHPGQVPPLIDEMQRRGWSDTDIQRRVRPYFPVS
jgi:hypothetical protein